MLATSRVQQQALFSLLLTPFVLSRDGPITKEVQFPHSFISKMVRNGNNKKERLVF